MSTPRPAPPADASRIGMVVPFDFALDREYWSYAPDSVSIHITRTRRLSGDVGVELATAVADPDDLTIATGSLVEIAPTVTAYACTSGSFVLGVAGEERIRQTLLAAGARAAITTSGAMLSAMQALGVRRPALLAPYTDDVGALLVAFLDEAGIRAVSLVSMGLTSEIAAVSEAEVVRMARSAVRPEADALFVSCTNLRTFAAIETLERALSIPVLTANQVTMWRCLQVLETAPSEAAMNQRLFVSAPPRHSPALDGSPHEPPTKEP